jgi:Domain of unknown function (DUF4281)
MQNMLAITPDLIFSLASSLALIAWIALAASPYRAAWAPRVRLLAGRVVPLVFAVVYVALFIANGMGGGGYDSIASVQRLMAVPGLLTAGWLHYLAFDLFVGAWIAERAGVLGMPHWVVVPLLALTFMFGPAGLLGFALLRPVWLRRHHKLRLA